MTCTCIFTMPTSQAGLAVTLKKRDFWLGSSEGSSRCCTNEPPGDEVVSFSPQKRTAAGPTFAMRSVPLTRDRGRCSARRRSPSACACAGPGTSIVTNEPIWLITWSEPERVDDRGDQEADEIEVGPQMRPARERSAGRRRSSPRESSARPSGSRRGCSSAGRGRLRSRPCRCRRATARGSRRSP